ncbi:hypothetical protein [Photobacterium kishitanii]|uniref:Uncharacterized protein n=1 Tax=Photobacterium kishitanii TaxID=318456 RepID=A0A2T3KLA1_9GAMM|nr:hypothetical protein [Photobacterium kishitanii]PSV00433.1 hypothetical protein C9J27_04695 [Photobacterium kishitanii]
MTKDSLKQHLLLCSVTLDQDEFPFSEPVEEAMIDEPLIDKVLSCINSTTTADDFIADIVDGMTEKLGNLVLCTNISQDEVERYLAEM